MRHNGATLPPCLIQRSGRRVALIGVNSYIVMLANFNLAASK